MSTMAENELNDLSPMPFGKHRDTPMQDVPASYFHWLWHKDGFDKKSPVGRYINGNRQALEMENDDLIWDWN